MPRGDAEITRELRGYVAISRLGIGTAVVGLLSFVLLMRGNVFDPDAGNWPLLVAAAVWALGMVSALWARSRVRTVSRERTGDPGPEEEADGASDEAPGSET